MWGIAGGMVPGQRASGSAVWPLGQFWVNPETNWARFYNPQFFINLPNAGDAAVENHVLSRVGSYGDQINTILSALTVLVARIPMDDGTLTPDEQRALTQLAELTARVDDALEEKNRGRRPRALTAAVIDGLVDDLADLARSQPAAHKELLNRLRRAFPEQALPQ